MKVLYTGSFNCWHKGHQYVYDLAVKMFGYKNVWIGVANNPNKDIDKHKILYSLVPVTDKIIVYDILTADVVKNFEFDLLIRGIRVGKSLEQEEELMYWNRVLGGVDTILIPTPPELNHISSSVIRELSKHNQKVDDYVNLDVYNRWLHSGPTNYVYFGKSCSGKSTYLKNNHIKALDTDKEIWNFIKDNQDKTFQDYIQPRLNVAFYNKDVPLYNSLIEEIANSVDWQTMFNVYIHIDAAVIGVYWDYIPANLKARSCLIKIETNKVLRNHFINERGVSDKFISSADFFYKDPPYWDKTIQIRNMNNA